MASQNTELSDDDFEDYPLPSSPSCLLVFQGTGSTFIHGNSLVVHTHIYTGLDEADGAQTNAPRERQDDAEVHDVPTFTKLDGIMYLCREKCLSESALVFEGQMKRRRMPPTPVAVKLFHLFAQEDEVSLKRELEAIQKIQYHNVVQHILSGVAPHHMWMYSVMEMCMIENLHQHVKKMRSQSKRFSFVDCNSSAKQLILALKHLHKENILHRDIKPSNILLSRDGRSLKLADFAFVQPVRSERSATADCFKRIGSDHWRAPETLQGGKHEKASDVYSLGLSLFFIWSNGEHAFGDVPDLINHNIKKNVNRNLTKICFKDPEQAGQLRQLVEKMLEFSMEKRLSASELASDGLCRIAEFELENWRGEDYQTHELEYRTPESPSLVVFERMSNSMYAFKPSDRSWLPLKALDRNIIGWNITAVLVRDSIYVLLEDRRVFRIKYTVEDTKWEVQDNMLLDHGDLPPATFLRDCIYVIGQSTKKSREPRKGERFDTTKMSWSTIPNMETERERHTVMACNGSVYSIGGMHNGGESNDASSHGEKFDPCTQTWSPIAQMNGSRYGASATSLNDRIYIFGGARKGINMLRDAEVYDTKTDTWTNISEMNKPRIYFGAATVNGKIYAVNGHGQSPLTIEEYDPDTEKWKLVVKESSKDLWPFACVSINSTNESK